LEQQAENQPSLREIIESLPLKTEGAGDTIGEGNARDFAKSLGVPSTLTDEEAETNDLASSSMSIKKIESSYLKSNDINAHELKSDIVGNKNMSKYDLYVETDTGEIFVFKKDGIGEGISTGIYIK
jgi:hypothetical protein